MSTYSYWRSDQGNMRALDDALAAQAASARARESSLNRRLQSLEGNLSNQVEVLSRLVNALIELGEVRDELTLFTPARRARDAARALTLAVVGGEGDVSHLRESQDLADVPGYWLMPAVFAVADVRAGRIDREAADDAVLRDRQRAATYLVAVCTLAGRPDLAEPWLPAVFESPVLPSAGWGAADGTPTGAAGGSGSFGTPAGDGPDEVAVTATERVLWRAAAAGDLGAAGTVQVREALTQRVGLLDDGAHTRLQATLLDRAPQITSTSPTGWGSPATSGDEVSVLRAWHDWAVAMADDAAATPSPAASEAPDPADGDEAEASVRDVLRGVLDSLVDEGAPVERELLARAELLNQRVGREAADDTPPWDAPAGKLVDLLVKDARSDDPQRAGLVAPLLVDDLRAVVHDRAAQYAAAPAPSRTVRVGRASVTVTPTDDGAREIGQAREEIEGHGTAGPSWPAIGGLGLVALVFLVLAFVVSPGFWVAVVLALVVLVAVWFSGRARQVQQRSELDRRLARVDADVAKARSDVAAEAEAGRTRQEASATLVDGFDEALAALSAPAA